MTLQNPNPKKNIETKIATYDLGHNIWDLSTSDDMWQKT